MSVVLFAINMVHYIDLFSYVETTLHSRIVLCGHGI